MFMECLNFGMNVGFNLGSDADSIKLHVCVQYNNIINIEGSIFC